MTDPAQIQVYNLRLSHNKLKPHVISILLVMIPLSCFYLSKSAFWSSVCESIWLALASPIGFSSQGDTSWDCQKEIELFSSPLPYLFAILVKTATLPRKLINGIQIWIDQENIRFKNWWKRIRPTINLQWMLRDGQEPGKASFWRIQR